MQSFQDVSKAYPDVLKMESLRFIYRKSEKLLAKILQITFTIRKLKSCRFFHFPFKRLPENASKKRILTNKIPRKIPQTLIDRHIQEKVSIKIQFQLQ